MICHFKRRTRPSALALTRALQEEGYRGRPINFGFGINPHAINSPQAIQNASNKRIALQIMNEAGVPTPILYPAPKIPCVARPDRHRAGSGFYLCREYNDLDWALRQGATHFMEFIEGGREFRVHIAFGKSIKIAEKIGGNSIIRNFAHGSTFMYPDFNHKKTLREVCKKAVMSLGLDFGAVDVIYKEGKYYVLEVNSAPSLTSNSDVLDRYVRAFKEEEEYGY